MINALIDDGSHIVLISNELVIQLSLKRQMLLEPITVELAMPGTNTKQTLQLSEYVKL